MFQLLLAGILAFCASWTTGAFAETVRVGGTGSGIAVVQLLAADFAEAAPDLQLAVAPSLGSGGSLKALAANALEMAVTARPLTPAEKAGGLAEMHWARSPFVFVVSPSTATTNVTTEELVDIYSGKRTRWADGTPIHLILRPSNDTDTALLAGLSPLLDQALQSASRRPGMLTAMTDGEAVELLTTTPSAFGPSTLGLLRAGAQPLRVLALNGVQPSLATMKDGSYPLAKDLYLITRADCGQNVRRLQAFLASGQARRRLEALQVAAP